MDLPPRDARIHVFSVSDGDLTLAHQTYLSRLDAEPPAATALPEAFGAAIDATYAEVFSVEDIAPMRLRDYLSQAHDIPSDTLAADAARLDALSGDVVVLAPRAIEGLTRLSPQPELTHIGSYPTAEADNAPRELPPAAKQPQLATPATATGTPVQRKVIPWIVIGALVLAVLVVALF
ncbi:hypothetical protein [Jannaschia sp. M317]|uniref:hypothetical protein n=1 Tax=Jannaschia sp. M317 TaxID=2867011 RepID=UPI0021A476D3|nr:hypothetical protein [Jannaschia sp. M317]UWQ19152.1 hypothetical protein K3551_07740 [Jannaschia sp. M317]